MRWSALLALLIYQNAFAAMIGEVTLLIGQATQTSAQGVLQNLKAHQNIFVGDTLETQASSHLHIKFVDGAFLSLKPRSRLIIEDYQAASGGQKAAIKFKLEEGIARAITGAWGEAARERFRLNTPIAAIGVRGTDFSVAANAQSLHTAVHQGAISVSPLDAQCSAQSFGSCQTAQTQLLSADMGQVMLAYEAHSQKIALLPLDDKLAPETTPNDDTPRKRLQDSANDHDTSAIFSAKNAENLPKTLPSLIWGRLQNQNESREIFRSAHKMPNNYSPILSTYNAQLFRKNDQNPLPQILENRDLHMALHDGEASFTNKNGVFPAQITAGTLSLNFAKQTFQTELDLSSGKLSHRLQSGGRLIHDTLLDQSGNAFVRGALANEGKEAAYFFYTVHPQGGVFHGLTHWQMPHTTPSSVFSGGQKLPEPSGSLP